MLALGYNVKKSILKGVLFGAITITVYLIIVILTTPNLPPASAVFATFKANSIIVIGLGIGIGIQMFVSSYSKSLGCELKKKKRILGSGTGGTVLGSFFSFFSLVPLGCCGSWLLMLSLLPSIFGTSVSIALIEYSQSLAYMSLVLVFGMAFLSAYKLNKRLKERKSVSDKSINRYN